MHRYFRLLGIFYKSSLIGELEYRFNFLANIGLSLFWLIWAALSVRVYFYHTDSISGWTYDQMLMVMGLFFALNGYRQMILQPNLSHMSDHVRLGTLDYVLTKPIDSQFLISFRFVGVYNWADPLLGLGLVGYGLSKSGHTPAVGEVALFAVLILAAMVLLYSLHLLLQTTTIWLVNIQQVDAIVEGLLETGRFPVSLYQGWVRAVLTVVFPIAFMTTFPAQALLGTLSWWLAAVAIALAVVLLVLASLFWRFALRAYTGSSA